MDTIETPPGLAVSVDQDAVVIRVERQAAMPILSILLHSKFSDGPRMDVLCTPYTNKMIEALMASASLTEYMGQREGMAQALSPVIELVKESAERENLPADEAASLMQLSIYPYNAT
ncbi:hypothetical protein [Sphingomonas sp.]|uniref:hypothetical protein n=1 Tax=Sphingomonas sp. TaxID=28214 RepID=UPI003F715E3E